MSLTDERHLTQDDFTDWSHYGVSLRLAQGEDGEHYALGHVDPQRMADAASVVDAKLGVLSEQDGDEWIPDDVRHRWALLATRNAGELASGEWRVTWVSEGTPGAFAMSVLSTP